MSEEVTAPKPLFKEGDICFDRQLRKYQYVRKVEGVGHIVRPYVIAERYSSDYGDFQYDTILGDGVVIVDELYRSATAVVADEMVRVAELREEGEKYKKIRSEAVASLRRTEQENMDIAKKLGERNAALRHIDALLDCGALYIANLSHIKVYSPGEAEHVLADSDPGYRNNMRGRKPKRKMLTLWGDTDGDLEWRINSYSFRDGTGVTMSFHATEAEAYAALDVHAEGVILGTEFKENQTYVGDDFKRAAVYLLSRTGRIMSALVYGKITHGADITSRARAVRDADRLAERKRAQIMNDAMEQAAAYLITLHGPLASLTSRDDIPDEVVKMFLPAEYFDEPLAGSATPMAAPAPVQPKKRKG